MTVDWTPLLAVEPTATALCAGGGAGHSYCGRGGAPAPPPRWPRSPRGGGGFPPSPNVAKVPASRGCAATGGVPSRDTCHPVVVLARPSKALLAATGSSPRASPLLLSFPAAPPVEAVAGGVGAAADAAAVASAATAAALRLRRAASPPLAPPRRHTTRCYRTQSDNLDEKIKGPRRARLFRALRLQNNNEKRTRAAAPAAPPPPHAPATAPASRQAGKQAWLSRVWRRASPPPPLGRV